MTVRARVLRGLLLLTAALAFAAGCSTSTKSPLDPGQRPGDSATLDARAMFDHGGLAVDPRSGLGWEHFFPLDSGSVWTYAIENRTTLIDPQASSEPVIMRGSLVTRILGTDLIDDTPYTYSTETTTMGVTSYEFPVLYRQDATGLFEADFNRASASGLSRPPASAIGPEVAARFAARIAFARTPRERAAWTRAEVALDAKLARVRAALGAASLGPSPAPRRALEIQRLAYPLRIGRRWTLREFPPVLMWVEGRDPIVVAGRRLLGWRIRLEFPDAFGPDDRVWSWYGPEGQLGFRYRVQVDVVDDQGNPVGTAVSEENHRLISMELARPPRGPF